MRAWICLVVLAVLVPACFEFPRELSVSRDGLVAGCWGEALGLFPVDGGPPLGLPLGLRTHEAAWSPDGSTVAVRASVVPAGGRLRSDGLWLVHRDGVSRRLHDGDALHPAWSPDGRRLAFLEPVGQDVLAPGSLRLHVLDVASRRIVRSVDHVSAFDWHPLDSGRLAAIRLEGPWTGKAPLVAARIVELALGWPRRARVLHTLTAAPVLAIVFPGGVRYARRAGAERPAERILFIGALPGSTPDRPLLRLQAYDRARGRATVLAGQGHRLTWWFSVSPSRTRIVALAGSPQARPKENRLYRVEPAGWTQLPDVTRPGAPDERRPTGDHLPGWITDDELVVQDAPGTLSILDVRTGARRPLFTPPVTRPLARRRPAAPPELPRPHHPSLAPLGALASRFRFAWQTRLEGPATRLSTTARGTVRVATATGTHALDGLTGTPVSARPARPVGRPRPPPLEDPRHPTPIAGPPGGHQFAAVTVGGQPQFGTFDVGRQRWIGRYVLDAPLAGPHVETSREVYCVTRAGQVLAFAPHQVDGLRIRWRRHLRRPATGLRYWRSAKVLLVTGDRTLSWLSPASGEVGRTITPGGTGLRLTWTQGLMLLSGRQTTPWLGRLEANDRLAWRADGRLAWRVECVERVVAATGRRLYAIGHAPGPLTLLEIDAAQGQVLARVALPAEVVCLGTGHGGPGRPLLMGLADGTVVGLTIRD